MLKMEQRYTTLLRNKFQKACPHPQAKLGILGFLDSDTNCIKPVISKIVSPPPPPPREIEIWGFLDSRTNFRKGTPAWPIVVTVSLIGCGPRLIGLCLFKWNLSLGFFILICAAQLHLCCQ